MLVLPVDNCVTATACYAMHLISRRAKYLKKLLINIMPNSHDLIKKQTKKPGLFLYEDFIIDN